MSPRSRSRSLTAPPSAARKSSSSSSCVPSVRQALWHRHQATSSAGLQLYGWIFGHSAVIHPDPAERAWAREELGWWVPRVRAALERTGAPA